MLRFTTESVARPGKNLYNQGADEKDRPATIKSRESPGSQRREITHSLLQSQPDPHGSVLLGRLLARGSNPDCRVR